MNNYNYKNLRPFKWFVLENFPFIEADFDAITNYQLYCKVVEYLNKCIENVNDIGDQMENVTNQMIALQNYVNNYFENLDVQDEIDNKLDDMVEAGTLQEIIADYLNSKAIFGFDNVSEMKNATNLINGSYAKTLGFYSVNDGGSATYKIRNITNSDIIDNATIIPMDNENLIAELIQDGNANVKQYGAKGNGVDDDYLLLQNCINKNENGTVYFPTGTYLISTTLNFKCNILMEQNAIITSNNSAINYLLLFNSTEVATSLSDLIKGKFIKGGRLDGKGIVSKLLGASNYMGLTIEDTRFENPKEFGLITRNVGNLSAELNVNNCYFYNNYNEYPNKPTGIYNNAGDNIFNNITMFNMFIAVDTVSGYFENIHPWLSKSELIAGSIAFKCNGNVSLIGCYADTYEKSFNNIGENLLRLVNCNVFYNDTVYNSVIATSNSPYIFYVTSNNSNIISNNLSVINNISGCFFINEQTNSYFNNTFFGGSEEVNKQYYVSNGFNNSIKSLSANTDVRTLGSGCYTNQNQTLVNFIPNITNTYGELIVFKNRTYSLLLYISHNSPNDVYYCIGAIGGTWRNWRKLADSTEITS